MTKFAKGLAWVCVLLLNFFFVYFSMLRGLQRGLEWQRLYCVACVIQLLAEVLFYETSECAVVNYFIPDLARSEVQGVTFAIHRAIQSMCLSVSEVKVPILDAPRYLFVSTRLAERFPDLLESVIVRSYHSYSPGELSRKWKISHGSTFVGSEGGGGSGVGSRVRRVTFTGVLVGCLQYLGSVSISAQRFLIRVLQPAVMTGVASVIGLIHQDPWYVLIFAPLLVYGLYRLWEHWHSDDDDDDGSREEAIVPVPAASVLKPTLDLVPISSPELFAPSTDPIPLPDSVNYPSDLNDPPPLAEDDDSHFFKDNSSSCPEDEFRFASSLDDEGQFSSHEGNSYDSHSSHLESRRYSLSSGTTEADVDNDLFDLSSVDVAGD